jgi:hypothetical protein
MFKLSVSIGRWPSLDRHQVEIKCPRCRLHTWVSFAQARRRDVVVCRGCHANIALRDDRASVHRAVRLIDTAFENLLKAFE